MNNERPSMSMFATAADYNAAMDEWLTTTKMLEAGERMAFEAYMKQDKLGQRPTPDGAGGYAVTEVDWAWEAWKARAALAASPSSKSTKEANESDLQPSGGTGSSGVVGTGAVPAIRRYYLNSENGHMVETQRGPWVRYVDVQSALASSSIKEDGGGGEPKPGSLSESFAKFLREHKGYTEEQIAAECAANGLSSPPSPLGDTPNTAHIRSVPGGAAFLRVAASQGDTPDQQEQKHG